MNDTASLDEEAGGSLCWCCVRLGYGVAWVVAMVVAFVFAYGLVIMVINAFQHWL